MKKYCRLCGREYQESDVFCDECRSLLQFKQEEKEEAYTVVDDSRRQTMTQQNASKKRRRIPGFLIVLIILSFDLVFPVAHILSRKNARDSGEMVSSSLDEKLPSSLDEKLPSFLDEELQTFITKINEEETVFYLESFRQRLLDADYEAAAEQIVGQTEAVTVEPLKQFLLIDQGEAAGTAVDLVLTYRVKYHKLGEKILPDLFFAVKFTHLFLPGDATDYCASDRILLGEKVTLAEAATARASVFGDDLYSLGYLSEEEVENSFLADFDGEVIENAQEASGD